jgi:hemerythrin
MTVENGVRVHWNEGLAIGVASIDAQHRELFDRVAQFEGALERSDATAVADALDFLRSYAAVHFADEEKLMREGGFPAQEEHRAQHREFAARLDALVREHREKGESAFLGLRTRNWILVWLLDHVGGRDQALGRHLLAAMPALRTA